MARFSILPAEERFFEWFTKAAQNAHETAEIFHALLTDFTHAPSKVAQITELEHKGDFIVHETIDLLSRTFITPMEGDEIRSLTSRLDDVVDYIEATADALLLYRVEQPTPEAIELSDLLRQMTGQIATAVPLLADKKSLGQVRTHAIEINRLENEADRVLRLGLARLVEQRSDWFEFFRWKEILQLIEDATDRCEDVADVLTAVAQKNA
ncbi:MAG: DUF47 domain-containing protein [Chloroflexi bacterium]|nr:DUF47 domain-containing protein [Chloroflexota bacterium]